MKAFFILGISLLIVAVVFSLLQLWGNGLIHDGHKNLYYGIFIFVTGLQLGYMAAYIMA